MIKPGFKLQSYQQVAQSSENKIIEISKDIKLVELFKDSDEFIDNLLTKNVISGDLVVYKELPNQISTPNMSRDMIDNLSIVVNQDVYCISGNGEYVIEALQNKLDGELCVVCKVAATCYVVFKKVIMTTDLLVGRYEFLDGVFYSLDIDYARFASVGANIYRVEYNKRVPYGDILKQEFDEGAILTIRGIQFKWKRDWTVELCVQDIVHDDIITSVGKIKNVVSLGLQIGDIFEFSMTNRTISRLRKDKTRPQSPYGLTGLPIFDPKFLVSGILQRRKVHSFVTFGNSSIPYVTSPSVRLGDIYDFLKLFRNGYPQYFSVFSYVTEYICTGVTMLHLLQKMGCCVDGIVVKQYKKVPIFDVRKDILYDNLISSYPDTELVDKNDIPHKHNWTEPCFYEEKGIVKLCVCEVPFYKFSDIDVRKKVSLDKRINERNLLFAPTSIDTAPLLKILDACLSQNSALNNNLQSPLISSKDKGNYVVATTFFKGKIMLCLSGTGSFFLPFLKVNMSKKMVECEIPAIRASCGSNTSLLHLRKLHCDNLNVFLYYFDSVVRTKKKTRKFYFFNKKEIFFLVSKGCVFDQMILKVICMID